MESRGQHHRGFHRVQGLLQLEEWPERQILEVATRPAVQGAPFEPAQ